MVSSIIFDLGGVLYDIDPARTQAALAKHGFILKPGEFDSQDRSSMIDQYERGHVSTAEFVEHIQKRTNPCASQNDIEIACCELMVGFTQARIDYLQQLGKQYRLFLLSNTNSLHIDLVNKQLREHYGVNNLSALFVKPYLSYQMGMRKPDKEIYQQVLQEQNLSAADTLFIDDTLVNVRAAERCGLSVLHKPRQQELLTALPDYLACQV